MKGFILDILHILFVFKIFSGRCVKEVSHLALTQACYILFTPMGSSRPQGMSSRQYGMYPCDTFPADQIKGQTIAKFLW